MKFLDFDNVLCLAPHPDDAEYSIGGTVIKYTDTNFDIVCLTQGGDCDVTTNASRLDEVRNSWTELDSDNFNLYFTPYKFLKDLGEDEWVNYLEKNFTDVKSYDAIMLPASDDSHFEHRAVSNLGWPLTRIKAISLIEYCSPSTLVNWMPNMFIDIENQYVTKCKMLKHFNSQLHRSYFKEDFIKGFHTNFQCYKKGLTLVEQFKLNQVYLR